MIFATSVGNVTLALPSVNRVEAETEIQQQKEAPRGSWRSCARLNIASISLTACHRSVLTKPARRFLARKPRQAIYAARDRTCSLRDSEVHTLSEVGRFRVVDTADLTQFAYSGDRSRMERDVYNLVRQGRVEQHRTSVLKQESRQVLALTKRGKRLIRH